MAGYEIGAIVIILIIAVVLIVTRWITRKRIKEIEDVDINGAIGLNFMPELTKGHFLLLEQKKRNHISGRIIIEALPMDIKWKGEKPELQPKIERLKLALGRHQRIPLATGVGSSEREVVFYNVLDEEKLPFQLKNSYLGKFLADMVSNAKVSEYVSLARDKAKATERNHIEGIFGDIPEVYKQTVMEYFELVKKGLPIQQPKEKQ